MFRGCSGVFRAVPGCSGDVPGMFRGVPGVFRGVPGCSGVFRGVPGFTDTPSRPLAVQKPNGRDALIGRFEWTRVLQIPLVWNLAPIMLRKLLLRL